MLDISKESLDFRRQCIDEFGGDTLDRLILKLHCDLCDFSGESSALVATTGFGFESVKQVREVVERIVGGTDESKTCPECDEPDIKVEKVFYLAYSEELNADFVAEFDPPNDKHGWLLGCYLNKGPSVERISVADERLSQVFRETLLRAAASASELAQNPELACQLIERCVELFGPSPRDRYLLATIQRDQGNYEAALATLSDLVEDPEETSRSLFEIGVTHFTALRRGEDQLMEAFTAFNTVLEFEQQHAPSHLYLGNIYLGLGSYEESLKHFEEALAVDQEMMEAHFNAGIALLNLERFDEALVSFERAHEITPGDSDVLRRMGETLTALGRSLEAAEKHKIARDIDLEAESIQETLEDFGLI